MNDSTEYEEDFDEFEKSFQLELQPIPYSVNPKHLTEPSNSRTEYAYLPHYHQANWTRTVKALSELRNHLQGCHEFSVGLLFQAIRSYNPTYNSLINLQNVVWHSPFKDKFFTQTLPNMITWALEIENLFPLGIPCLAPESAIRSITLSREQVRCLLSNLFLCTFHTTSRSRNVDFRNGGTYPSIGCQRLYGSKDSSIQCAEKIKCFLNYFNRIAEKEPEILQAGITFERYKSAGIDPSSWRNIGIKQCFITVERPIEMCHGCVQVDFADRVFGGMILGPLAAQEEILLCHRPELIVGRIFTAILEKDEALHIVGSEMFNRIEGYAKNIRWGGNYLDGTPTDNLGRIRSNICAIDALHLKRKDEGYGKVAIDRDLIKAFAGFKSLDVHNNYFNCIATGFWGCGVFKGDKEMKAITQLLACTVNNRQMLFSTFGDTMFANKLDRICKIMCEKNVKAYDLYQWLITAKPHERIFENIFRDLNNMGR